MTSGVIFCSEIFYRQYRMMLAMTTIAATASICASASEAALLVASFTSISLDLGHESSLPAKA